MMGFREGEKIEKGFGQQLRKHLNVTGAINTHQNSDSAEVDAGGVVESRAGTTGTEMAELITKANILRK